MEDLAKFCLSPLLFLDSFSAWKKEGEYMGFEPNSFELQAATLSTRPWQRLVFKRSKR